MKHTVKISDVDYTLNTTQESPTTWTAGGDYKGNTLYVRDRSEAAAIKRWSDTARAKGNA